MTEAFPLHWPDGWPRHRGNRLWSLPGGRRHTPSWNSNVDRLTSELRRLGATNIVLSTNQPLRRDGLPYAATRHIDDPGAAVYFVLHDKPMAMAQDRYELLLDNIRSLALAIEGMRQMQRHGGGHMMERAFSGFEALPAPGGHRHWTDVLGVSAGVRIADLKRIYRELSFERHPDHGGDAVAMAELNAAFQSAMAELQE